MSNPVSTAWLRKHQKPLTGSVVHSFFNMYVVVEVTERSIYLVWLWGRIPLRDDVIEATSDMSFYRANRQKERQAHLERWNKIAEKFPAINRKKEKEQVGAKAS